MGIWIGQYAIVNGEAREHGPRLVERRRITDDETVRLLVLAEPADDRSAEFCGEIADAVAELFVRESLSVTGGMLRAMRQAHANLEEWNRRSLRQHHIAVGVTCVAIRGTEATIGQVGGSIAYLRDARGLHRLATEGEPSARPLGGAEPIEPQFLTVSLIGTELLVLSGDAEQVTGAAAIDAALAAGPERALGDLFRRTHGLQNISVALVVEVEGLAEDATPAPVLFEEDDLDPGEAPAFAGESGRGFGVPIARPAAPGGVRLPTLRRPRGGPRAAGRRVDADRTWRVLVLGALAVLALVFVAVCAVPPLLREDSGKSLSDAIASAESHLQQAEQGTNAAQQRQAGNSALQDIARARSIAPQDARIAPLEARAKSVLQRLDMSVDVSALRTVQRLEGVITAPLQPAALMVGGGALWVLERERGRIFRLDAQGERPPVEVYRQGASYSGQQVRDPISMAWDEQGQRLLVLDGDRRLVSVPLSGDAQVLKLRDVGELKSAVAITVYGGNLYILDSQGGEVWRYLPAADGYDSERAGLLGGLDIADARLFAVDGDLYLLGTKGARRFRAGQQVAQLFAGIDRPAESTTAIVTDRQRGRVYVADRGGKRVIVSTREGAFSAQYRHTDFADLRGLALAVDGQTLYVLTGTAVLAFDPVSGAPK